VVLIELAEKIAVGDQLRELEQLLLQRLMGAVADAQCGAGMKSIEPSGAIIATATVSAPSRRV
jgi:hypothetical protein